MKFALSHDWKRLSGEDAWDLRNALKTSSYYGSGGYGGGTAPGQIGGYLPSLGNLRNYDVTWDQWEGIRQSLYDSAAYPSAGVNVLQFFSVPQGQGTGFGGAAKTLSDTNMTLANSLPNGVMMLVRSIEVDVQPTTPTVAAQMPAAFGAQAIAQIVNDMYIIRRSGNLKFTILQKDYVQEAPLTRFPPSAQFALDAAAADISTTGGNMQTRIAMGKVVGRPFILTPANILLVSNENFGITLNWPEGLQTITNPARIFVRLDGFLYRKVQ